MNSPRSADAGAVPSQPRRWRDPKVATAWIAVFACVGLVLWAGSEAFSAASTSRILRPLLVFLFPDLTPGEIWRAQVLVRKTAHAVEYAVLALLAFRALWLSFDTLVARIAAGALLLALAVATVDEVRQGFTRLRTGAPSDVVLDCAGALLAVGIAAFVLRRRQATQERRRPSY